MNPELKYGGEALTLMWLAFRLLRWAWGAVSEGDAPPSADIGNLVAIGAGITGTADERLAAMRSDSTHPRHLNAALQVVDPSPEGRQMASPVPGDPALFPPEMLAAMTPEQRARVIETLAEQRAKGTAA